MSSSIVACPACSAKNRVPAAASGCPQCAKCHAPLPWLVNASDDTFASATATDQLVLVDLWAPWCGPCRMVGPIVERLAKRYAGRLKVVKVNVDDNRRTASRYGAQSIPTLVLLRDGEVVDRIVGAQPEHVMRQHVDAYLGG
ncbi:MAG: thioredoxin [Propioniciclava sp.]|uniref:thioredoxin n=1 Tax=Propioniciclava sp. TaxID=2038686 RepID=UPI0039E22738